MAEGTSTKSSDDAYEKAVLKLKKELSWFHRNVAPRVLKNIIVEFESIQDNLDIQYGVWGEYRSIQNLAAYVDALHKTLTMVQQLEDINGKGMLSDRQ